MVETCDLLPSGSIFVTVTFIQDSFFVRDWSYWVKGWKSCWLLIGGTEVKVRFKNWWGVRIQANEDGFFNPGYPASLHFLSSSASGLYGSRKSFCVLFFLEELLDSLFWLITCS